jgi:hypothetical protein
MAQVQQGTASNAPSKIAVFAVGIALALAGVVIAVAIAVSTLSRPATGFSAGAQNDPLTSKAAIEFRAAERAVQANATDPFLTQSAIEFRAGERGYVAAGVSSDPLLTQRAIDFRAEERAVGN